MSLHPAVNRYFPLICKMHVKFITFCNNEDLLVAQIGHAMKKKFDKYWEQGSTILSMTSILDLRYKLSMIEFWLTKIYGANVAEIKDQIQYIYNNYKLKYNGQHLAPTGESGVATCPSSSTLDVISNIEEEFDHFSDAKFSCSKQQSELDIYYGDSVAP